MSRSCIYCLIVIKNRPAEKKNTFSTFVDLQKVFSYGSWDALLYKLLVNKVDGTFTTVKVRYRSLCKTKLLAHGLVPMYVGCAAGA